MTTCRYCGTEDTAGYMDVCIPCLLDDNPSGAECKYQPGDKIRHPHYRGMVGTVIRIRSENEVSVRFEHAPRPRSKHGQTDNFSCHVDELQHAEPKQMTLFEMRD